MNQPNHAPVRDQNEYLAALKTLQIDRSATESPKGDRKRWILPAAALLLMSAAIAVWQTDIHDMVANAAPPASTALAAPATPTLASPGSSKPSETGSTGVLDATGYIVARRQSTVSAKVTGKVLEVLVEEGMHVQEGQLLARLDAQIPRAHLELARSQHAAALAGMQEVRVQIRQAKLDHQRLQQLHAQRLASMADRDRAELTLQSLEARLQTLQLAVVVAERNVDLRFQELADMDIRAPFAGIVTSKTSQPGEMISPVSSGGGFTRTGICTIVDMQSLEVQVDVSESLIHRVHPQQSVSISANAYPDVQVAGNVIAIIPTADRNKATIKVRIALQQITEGILPDMGVKVTFSAPAE